MVHQRSMVGAAAVVAIALGAEGAPAAAQGARSGIVGVKHVGVPVRDQDRALEFYTRVLGFTVAVDEAVSEGDGRWIELAIPDSPTRVLLVTGPDVEDRVGTFTNIVLLSDDVAASYRAMRARGVRFDIEPTALPGGGMNAVFRDPDGNTFALATPDGPSEPIPSGDWSATLREPDGQAMPFTASVSHGAGGVGIAFVMQGARFSMQQVRASGDELRFSWRTPGPVVVCALGRGPGGVYEGDCIDQDEGDRKHLALRPPER